MEKESNSTDKILVTRNDLYNLIWTESFLALSKKYSISDVGLRKICVRMNIPTPKSGYWQKVRSGKKVKIPALPTDYTGEENVTLSFRKEGDEINRDEQSPLSLLQGEFENDSDLLLTVPVELTKPHPLIVAAKKNLSKSKPGHNDELVYSNWETIDINVSPANLTRALCFLDTLFKALETRGHTLTIENGNTYVVAYGEKVQISFREKRNRTLVKGNYSWNTSVYTASGMISFRMGYSYHLKEWKDGKQQTLEQQLSKILASIELKGQELKEEELERVKNQKEYALREIERQEHKKKHDKELKNFRKLQQDSERWKKAVILREYIEALDNKSGKAGLSAEEFNAWILWAKKKADWYDPEINATDELLTDTDKDEVHPSKPNVWGYY